ncbi:hypothetical protein ANO11243_047580 [Dothideomycetidae sp. 11243]|nr:hypothetical protein ANO11243_047580 [fungal sp. No.11243]
MASQNSAQSDTPSPHAPMVAVLFAAVGMQVDQAKIAALLGVPKTTVKNWVSKQWRPQATKLLDEAKAAGRIDADGNVVGETVAKARPRSSGAGGSVKREDEMLHSVKTGKVTKKGIARVKKAKVEVQEDDD